MARDFSITDIPPMRRSCELQWRHFSYDVAPVVAFVIDHTQSGSTTYGGGAYVCAPCAARRYEATHAVAHLVTASVGDR